MSECKRVLQVLGTTNLGGAESRIMDLYRHFNRERIQFDFLIHTSEKGHFDDEIEKLGGRIYRLPAYRFVNHLVYKWECKKFFAKHNNYVAVHGHMTSTASIYLPIAKRAGIPLTIAHARSAGVDKGLKGMLTKCLRHSLYKKADCLLACSDLAAIAVFGKKQYEKGEVSILPNAIDTMIFKRNDVIRNEIRSKYGLQNKFVIGHVGRFHYAKNHEFLLTIFKDIAYKNRDARLLLVGDGPLREQIEQKADNLGIMDKVIFTGNQTPVSPFYQAMDVFIFPSRFEGMPGTVVEAQAAGLPCLISDTITKEVKATDLISFYSIHTSSTIWADATLQLSKTNRIDTTEVLKKSGFDVNGQVTKYEQFYLSGNRTNL